MGPMHDPPHPGQTLRDGWLSAEMSAEAAADQIGVTHEDFAAVLEGRQGITPALALQLEAAGWLNAALWMRLQAAYDLAQERLRRECAA